MARKLYQRRKYETRPENKILYIYSEGAVTEVQYFMSIKKELRLSQINIEPIGTGFNTMTLVDHILEDCVVKDDNVECWAVFDKDDFPEFNKAIEKGIANGIKVAYSNESFELWFILHFDFLHTALGRDKFGARLTKLLGVKYEKNMNIYPFIKDREAIAIKNAKKLEKIHESNGTVSFQERVPSTTVYKLVERLRGLENPKQGLR